MDNSSAEYTALRQEITVRALVLHLLLGLGSGLLLLAAGTAFFLYSWSGGDRTLTENFLLTLPIIFSCLTFGYQANQWTLEQVAYFLRDHSQNKTIAANWENYYAGAKRHSELLSFLKVLPLLLPQLLPFILMELTWGQSVGILNQSLILIDIALFLLVIISFRYKLKHS